jgi:hypothetical protein
MRSEEAIMRQPEDEEQRLTEQIMLSSNQSLSNESVVSTVMRE